jgi:hypothetical protein
MAHAARVRGGSCHRERPTAASHVQEGFAHLWRAGAPPPASRPRPVLRARSSPFQLHDDSHVLKVMAEHQTLHPHLESKGAAGGLPLPWPLVGPSSGAVPRASLPAHAPALPSPRYGPCFDEPAPRAPPRPCSELATRAKHLTAKHSAHDHAAGGAGPNHLLAASAAAAALGPTDPALAHLVAAAALQSMPSGSGPVGPAGAGPAQPPGAVPQSTVGAGPPQLPPLGSALPQLPPLSAQQLQTLMQPAAAARQGGGAAGGSRGPLAGGPSAVPAATAAGPSPPTLAPGSAPQLPSLSSGPGASGLPSTSGAGGGGLGSAAGGPPALPPALAAALAAAAPGPASSGGQASGPASFGSLQGGAGASGTRQQALQLAA